VVYRNRVRNLINFVGTARGCASSFGCYTNVNRATLQGATLSASQRLGDVTLRASLDVQDPKDADTGNLLARRAKRHGTLGADWRVAGWTLGAEVQASSQRYDDTANTVKLGGYTLLNLSASTQIARDLNLIARIDNVGDKDYQFARLYANGGRSAYLGLKWTPQ
jgi:vitamin B12 transporter